MVVFKGPQLKTCNQGWPPSPGCFPLGNVYLYVSTWRATGWKAVQLLFLV